MECHDGRSEVFCNNLVLGFIYLQFLAEYFGQDCSFKRCPGGDDPVTKVVETECSGVVAAGGFGTGANGNKCHVDCSNRGICDYTTGTCTCFKGYYSADCSLTSELAV